MRIKEERVECMMARCSDGIDIRQLFISRRDKGMREHREKCYQFSMMMLTEEILTFYTATIVGVR